MGNITQKKLVIKENEMKVICAGFPKTASKSCSTALRQLGFRVADTMENIEFLMDVWLRFVTGKCSIDEVVERYKQHGFDANQDSPSNFLWHELHTACPSAKVILTVRDNEEIWWRSWSRFVEAEHRRKSVCGVSTMKLWSILAKWGYMGQELRDKYELQEVNFCDFMPHFTDVLNPKSIFVAKTISQLAVKEAELKQMYTAHNKHVIRTVPAEQLLVWHVKDGWEPLCSFLGLPKPDGPFPHDNKTGDGFMERYAWQTEFIRDIQRNCIKQLVVTLFKLVICSVSVVYCLTLI